MDTEIEELLQKKIKCFRHNDVVYRYHNKRWPKVRNWYITKFCIHDYMSLDLMTEEHFREKRGGSDSNIYLQLANRLEVHDIYYSKDRLKNDEAKHAEAWRAVNCEIHTMACA